MNNTVKTILGKLLIIGTVGCVWGHGYITGKQKTYEKDSKFMEGIANDLRAICDKYKDVDDYKEVEDEYYWEG